jgi:FMN-dependent NADH-azoreductase
MSKLLYIAAPPLGGRSTSIAVADAFVDAYHRAHPADEITILNLFQVELLDPLQIEALPARADPARADLPLLARVGVQGSREMRKAEC